MKRSGGFLSDGNAQAHTLLYSIAETWRMRSKKFAEVLTGMGWEYTDGEKLDNHVIVKRSMREGTQNRREVK